MTTTGLVVEDLSAGYGKIQIVEHFNLNVAPREIVALVGRNGAGKTTSLLAVAGLRYGSGGGSVHMGGRDISHASASAILGAGIALVPEGHRLFGSLSVRDNLELGAYSRRRGGRAALAESQDRVLALFPILAERLETISGNLSGGQQQMVAIGQALMANPEVLLLDEPSSGLAPVLVDAIYDALKKLREQGVGILVVEQNIDRAIAQSDRCVVLDSGRVVLEGSSRTIDVVAVSEIIRGVVAGGT